MVYVLLVELAAAASAGVSMPGTLQAGTNGKQLLWLGLLLAGAIAHAELMKRLERLHQAASSDVTTVTTETLWFVAGLVILPFPLVVALIGVCWLHQAVRVTRNSPSYRMVFSAAASVLASFGAAAVLALGGVDPGHLAEDVRPVVWLLLAVVARDIAGIVVLVPAILLSDPRIRLRSVLGTPTEHAFELGAGVLGVLLAITLTTAPAMIPLVAVLIGVLGYASRLTAFEQLAQRDDKTDLLRPGFWQQLANREHTYARRLGQPVGVLMIDIDRFKLINDQYGHATGDIVLRSVADAITAQLRDECLAGRFGGEEFVVFVRNVTRERLHASAERVRRAVADLTIIGPRGPALMTISIGACWSTDPNETLSDVLLAADTALFAAKNAGRNRTELSPLHDR